MHKQGGTGARAAKVKPASTATKYDKVGVQYGKGSYGKPDPIPDPEGRVLTGRKVKAKARLTKPDEGPGLKARRQGLNPDPGPVMGPGW